MEASVSLMIMYEDESVDVRYANGSQLQLSPCGCEFVLLKAKDPSGHPLQPTERVRQRTRFTISLYKELMLAALEFRNKFASRPYLPKELIPADQKKPFFSIDSNVQWPEWSSCEAEFGPGGETIIRSEEGRAVLVLSPSGEEFSTEFTCSLSPTQGQPCSMQCCSRDPSETGSQKEGSHPISQTVSNETKDAHQGRRNIRNEPIRSRSCSPQLSKTAQSKPEEMYQSTTVVQHHSCSAVAHMWCYPLSLARHLYLSHLFKSKDVRTSDCLQADSRTNMLEGPSEERRSHLPQPLPLTCSSPHWHRWKTKEPQAGLEPLDQNLPTEHVKVMCCQGVTYRILSGAVPVIEVSPGDGSVIRSNGVLNNYFTHHKPNRQSGQVKEVTYHLNSLPPDVPGQTYSTCSIVNRASRILTCYNQARQSLNFPAAPSCLQEYVDFSKPVLLENNMTCAEPLQPYMNATQTAESRSDLVAAELEKIKRFNFLLENSHLLRSERGRAELQDSSAEEMTHGPVTESCVSEALQRTSRVIHDIDALVSGTVLME